ncbi:hybrid sensor histidine kinase/response regulator [Desulfosudis oleivorans]|uniref:histidine kinase n=1 Tax=Desulfosudis oleivorans (strain DSM 6200 / JCM 39069 / Hxd3) TaxID=96561 RepID=A9A0Q0_DESOH|nr:PAS domain S-box protein [Desulfosudis oleivorans]ABW69067.1 PAS/PAC sensor hybrid histidine kinase [Desulfosudis oleivorans Hxd3]
MTTDTPAPVTTRPESPFGKRGLLSGLAGVLALLLVAGAMLIWQTVRHADGSMRADLLEQARLVAGALDLEKVLALSGTAADLEAPAYRDIKKQLGALHRTHGRARFIYLLGQRPDGGLFFLADSEPAESQNLSPPGQPYEEASAGLLRVFATGTGTVEGPEADRWGTWVSALVPLFEPQTGRVAAVLGMDVDARRWQGAVLAAAAWPSVLTAALIASLALSFALAVARRRTLNFQTEIARARKQAEQAAAETERERRLLQTLLHAIPAPVFFKDRNGLYLGCNPAFEAITGKTEAEILGKRPHEIWPENYSSTYRDKDLELLKTGGKQQYEYQYAGPDGTARDVVFYKSAFQDSAGRVDGLVGVMLDISERKQAEEALRESEKKYRVLIDGLPDIVMRFDRDGRHLFVSDNISDLIDLPAARFIGRTHRELDFPEPACRFWEKAIQGVFDSKTPFETEFRFQGKQGEVVFNWRLIPEQDAHGEIRSVLSFCRNVTAHRKIEQDYHTLFREMLDGFALHEIIRDAAGRAIDYRFLAVNPAFERMTGLAAREIVGKTVLEVLPDTEPYWIERYAGVAETGDPVFFEEHARALEKYFAVTAFRPAPNQFASIFQDITERKQAEEALRKNEERYRSVLDNIETGYYEVDLAGNLTFFNPSLCKILGYPSDEAMGMNYKKYMAPETAKKVFQIFNHVFRTGETDKSFEWTLIKKNGEKCHVATSISLMRDTDGNPIGFRGIERDITEHKQAEAEKEKLSAQLIQARKMEAVGRLAGGVAHDFNNMLNVIVGHAELALDETRPDDPVCETLNEILGAARRSAEITRQLLAFARKQTIHPRVLDLNATMGDRLKVLQRLLGEDVDMAWTPGPDLWPVRMDPSQIDQVMANLLDNARDAIDGVGRVEIETDNVRLGPWDCVDCPGLVPGEYVRLSVRDTGRGMDRKTLDNLFEPFFTTKGVGEGTGLGLATVYGIIKQNNGFIYAASRPGQGTAFTVYLPRHAGAPEPAPSAKGQKAPAASGGTVLVVEDEASVLKLVQRVLERLGYNVLTALGPARAITMADEHQGTIDLLITDVIMPEMSGRDLAKTMKKRFPDLRVLYMSGYTADIIGRRGELEADVNFIQKPFSNQDMAEKVRDALKE